MKKNFWMVMLLSAALGSSAAIAADKVEAPAGTSGGWALNGYDGTDTSLKKAIAERPKNIEKNNIQKPRSEPSGFELNGYDGSDESLKAIEKNTQLDSIDQFMHELIKIANMASKNALPFTPENIDDTQVIAMLLELNNTKEFAHSAINPQSINSDQVDAMLFELNKRHM